MSSIAVAIGSYFCGPAAALCAAAGQYQISRAFGATRADAIRAGGMAGISTAAFQAIGHYYSGLNAANFGPPPPNTFNFGGNYLTSGQIAGQISSHAITGGILAEAQGGKFGHGFVSAFVTKATTNLQLTAANAGLFAGTVTAAVIGDTTSVLTGGKFANGARTVAYQFLFNAAKSMKRSNKQGKVDRNNLFKKPVQVITTKLLKYGGPFGLLPNTKIVDQVTTFAGVDGCCVVDDIDRKYENSIEVRKVTDFFSGFGGDDNADSVIPHYSTITENIIYVPGLSCSVNTTCVHPPFRSEHTNLHNWKFMQDISDFFSSMKQW